MESPKDLIKFQDNDCRDLFDKLPEEIVPNIFAIKKTYTPKVFIVEMMIGYYPRKILDKLIAIKSFIAIKRRHTYSGIVSEIQFEIEI